MEQNTGCDVQIYHPDDKCPHAHTRTRTTSTPTLDAGNGTVVEDTGDTNITFELPSTPPVDDEGILNGANGIWALVTVIFGIVVWLQTRNTSKLVDAIENLNGRTVASFERMYDGANATTRQAVDTVHSIFELASQMNIPGVDAIVEAVEYQFDEITDGIPVVSKPVFTETVLIPVVNVEALGVLRDADGNPIDLPAGTFPPTPQPINR